MIDNMKPPLLRPAYAAAPLPGPSKQQSYDERVKQITEEHRVSIEKRWDYAAGFGKGGL